MNGGGVEVERGAHVIDNADDLDRAAGVVLDGPNRGGGHRAPDMNVPLAPTTIEPGLVSW